MMAKRQRRGGWLWLYAIVMVLLFVYPFDHTTDRLFRTLWNWLHLPAFVVLAWMFSARLQSRRRAVQIGVWIGLLLLVPLIEVVQEYTGRTFSWADVWVGWAGIVVGGWLLPRRSADTGRYTRRLVGAGMVLLITLAPTLWVLTDRMLMIDQFPVLATFSWPGEQGRWVLRGVEVVRTRDHAGQEGHTWRVTVQETYDYPGLFMTDLLHDWSRAKGLVLHLYVPGTDSLAIWVRIDDREQAAYTERFQVRKSLEPGFNRIQIEWPDGLVTEGGREMALSRIQEWGVFFEADAAGRVVYLDRAELEWSAYYEGYR